VLVPIHNPCKPLNGSVKTGRGHTQTKGVAIMATRKRRRSARRNPQSIIRRLLAKRRRNSWPDNTAGHSKAARKGWRKLRSGKRRKNPHAATYMPNPFRSRRRHRRHGFRLNPPAMLRRLLPSKGQAFRYAKLGLGVAGGFMATPIVSKVLSMAKLDKYDKYAGVGTIVLGALLTGMAKKKDLKDLGLLIAGFGVYDLLASNSAGMLPALPRVTGLTSNIPGMAPLSSSYGVAAYSVSRSAASLPMSSSYQQISSSYQDNASMPVGISGDSDMVAMGHLPGIDFEE